MVPIRSLAEIQSLDASEVDAAALKRAYRAVDADASVMVFTLETERPESAVHVRLFAPALGVPEDAATGSANGALGAYLVHHRAVPVTEPTTYIVSEQGAEMNQLSTLYIEVDSASKEITAVRAGGQVVSVIEGVVGPGTCKSASGWNSKNRPNRFRLGRSIAWLAQHQSVSISTIAVIPQQSSGVASSSST